MEVLLIKNEQDLIFKSKSSSVPRKHKNKQRNNSLTFNPVGSDIEANPKLSNFINLYFDLSSRSNYLTSILDQINLEKLTFGKFSSILNLKKVNDIRYINKFFETVNTILPNSGLYLGKLITYPYRRSVILKKYPPIINKIIYFFDYIFSRLLPKIPISKKIYFFLTRGKGRVMSRAEMYGRLYSCGFEIIDEKSINKSLFFVAKKVKDPYYDKNPTYAPLISLDRIGKNGKIFTIYKFRTMIENAEKDGAVFTTSNDTRVTSFGKFLRKTRLDEFPQFFNILRGEMAIIGPRPERAVFVTEIAELMPFYETRHVIKPGLTGWAQVNYAYGDSVADSLVKLQYDLYYIKHRSVFLDINIFVKTLSTVLFFRGQ